MAADNVKDLFKQALKLTSEGKLDKAIETYLAIIKKTPKDTRVLNNLGDIYLRKKMHREAAGIFGDLARLYEEDGYTLRAIAICQKVLKIDPELSTIKARMAELYAKQGLVAEARTQYLDLAGFLERKGQVKDALEIFRKLADLDPTNCSVRAKLGNMFHKEGMFQKAAVEWIKAAEGYLKHSKPTEAYQYLEKAVGAEPSNKAARVMLAGEEVRREKPERAIELLQPVVDSGEAELDALRIFAAALLRKQRYAEAAQVLQKAAEKEPGSLPIRENLGLALLKSGTYQQAVEVLLKIITTHLRENRWERAEKLSLELLQANPDDAAVLQKLVEVYTHSGDNGNLIKTYRGLVDLYERRGLKKNVIGICEKLRSLQPDNPEWGSKLEHLAGHEAPPAEEAPPRAVEEAPAEEDLGVTIAEEDLGEEIVVESEEITPPPASPLEEAQNLLKRGMFKDAELRLQRMLMKETTLPALRTLKELYRIQGKKKSYIDTCQDIVALLSKTGGKEECIQEYQDVLQMDPGNQAAKEALADLVVEVSVGHKPLEAPPEEALEPLEEAPAAEVEISQEEMEAAEFDLAAMAGEAEEPERAPVAAAPPAPVAPAAAPAQEDLDEMIAEAEFYFQQGLHAEAEKLYRAILSRDPGRLDVAAKLDAVSAKLKGTPAQEEGFKLGDQDLLDFEKSLELGLRQPRQEMKFSVTRDPGEATPAVKAGFSDFLSDLREEMAAPPPVPTSSSLGDESLQEIFQEFQQGIRQNLSSEDFETHYNLGIAYKEMGLADEAVGEFELAARSPDFHIDAVSMIALIRRDQGRMAEAVQSLQSALDKVPEGDEARKGLLWELAGVHEEMGEKERAVELYLAVYGMDGSYRSIKEKLEELGATPPGADKAAWEAPPAEKPAPAKAPGKKSTRVSYI